MKKTKSWNAWTREDREYLVLHFGKYLPSEIAKTLARCPLSIEKEAGRLKLPVKQKAYRKQHFLTPSEICKFLPISRRAVDQMFDLGLPYFALPGRFVVRPEHLGRFLRGRPEILDPEKVPPETLKLLGYTDDYEPPNFKWFRCGKNPTQWKGVYVTHPRVWISRDLFKLRSGTCPVCNRGLPMWAEAYSNECKEDVHAGARKPRGSWSPPEGGRDLRGLDEISLLEMEFIREFLPTSLQTPQWPFLQAPQWPLPQALQSPQAWA